MAFKPRKDECGFLGCEDLREIDLYVCAAHHEVLRSVREAMVADEDPYGTRTQRSRASRPQCTRPGCRNPRKAGESMCADCAEEAFWEDAAG